MTKEELEKEAEEYTEKHWGASPSVIRALKQTYLTGAEPREKRIAELEARCNELFLQICKQAEKIKELKEYNKYLRRKRQGGIQKQYNKVAIIKQQDDQLTKAKELLREIIDTPVFNQMGGELYENEGYVELVEEAEQFLKEQRNEKSCN